MERPELRCRSCKVLFSQHLGLEGTCEELRQLQAELERKNKALYEIWDNETNAIIAREIALKALKE